jgi:glycosyltransferase involved in cell wall biosynthesis
MRFNRWLAYTILRHSRSLVFGVGRPTLEFFKRIGFPENRVVNLPIFIDSDEDVQAHRLLRAQVLANHGMQTTDFVLSAGSRLIFEKGYDLLIKAVAQLEDDIRRRAKVLIVGSGPCAADLKSQIAALGLEDQVILVNWLAIEDFKTLIACSDVFIHPARIDAYGGTTLGMALGVPVIGSTGAGAAVDRIEHGLNGFLYEPEDTARLAEYITLLFREA